MENKFTPEAIVLATAKGMKEGAEVASATLKPLAIPFLRAFTWGLDELIGKCDTLKTIRPVTSFMKYKAWEEEYRKRGFLS